MGSSYKGPGRIVFNPLKAVKASVTIDLNVLMRKVVALY
jgi:hypothetical protein